MKISTIHIMVFIFVFQTLAVFFFALIIEKFYSRRNHAVKRAISIHKLISWIFTVLISVCGFYLTAVILEALKLNVDVGDHNVVGAVFFMFFFVLFLGKWLISFSSSRIEIKLGALEGD